MAAVQDTSTRARLVQATAGLLAEQGPSGTGTAEILRAAGAPRGSFYFHFPGGKEELVRAAVSLAGEQTRARIDEVFSTELGLPDQVERYFRVVADELSAQGYRRGCAVAATATDLGCSRPLVRETAAAVFVEWRDAIESYLVAAGLSAASAVSLALSFISALEGATIVARTLGDPAPLTAAGQTLRAVTAALLGPQTN